MLTEWFRAYSIDGTTLRKAMSFFINALKDADEPLSNSLKKLARNKAPSGSASGLPARKGRTKKDPPPNPPQGREGATPTPETSVDEAAAQTSLMLRGLFKSLPSPGSNFPSSQRTSWLEAAKALSTLTRIHRWTGMDGVRTAEGGEGVTGAMIRARIWVGGRLAGGLQALLGAVMATYSGCDELRCAG